MENVLGLKKGLNGNVIKILALITMTVDHAGLMLFGDLEIMRIIGRLSFPLFAFMIAEGCYYTKNKLKHFLFIFILGAVCQTVYYFYEGRLYFNILLTFSLSELIIFAIDFFKKKPKVLSAFLVILAVGFAVFMCYFFPELANKRTFKFDYGFWGIMLPVFVYLFKNPILKIITFAIGLAILCYFAGGIQWYSMFTVLIMLFYDGTKGKLNLKYLFYIYYPLHLLALEGIYMLMQG